MRATLLDSLGINRDDLIKQAVKVMSRLANKVNTSVTLGTLVKDEPLGMVLTHVVGRSGFSFHLEENYTFPIHTSAPGKAIMAYLPEKERNRYLDQMTFTRFNDRTIANRKAFLQELDNVRDNQYAVDRSEEVDGCHCVGVPVFLGDSYPAATIWTSGNPTHLPEKMFSRIGAHFRQAAEELAGNFERNARDMSKDYIETVIRAATQHIDEHIAETIDIKKLAAEMHVSYSWFRQVFKDVTGLSPHQYVLKLRFDKARTILTNTDLTINDIATQLGYDNQNYFSKMFRTKIGLSPEKYRDNARQKCPNQS